MAPRPRRRYHPHPRHYEGRGEYFRDRQISRQVLSIRIELEAEPCFPRHQAQPRGPRGGSQDRRGGGRYPWNALPGGGDAFDLRRHASFEGVKRDMETSCITVTCFQTPEVILLPAGRESIYLSGR